MMKQQKANRPLVLPGVILAVFAITLLVYYQSQPSRPVVADNSSSPSSSSLWKPTPSSFGGASSNAAPPQQGIILPPVQSDSKEVLIQVLDYRRVIRDVYEPAQYAVCPLNRAAGDSSSQHLCWPQLTKQVDCAGLFNEYLHVLETHQPVLPGPNQLPADQKDEFLLQNYTQLSSMYRSQMSHAPTAEVPVWTSETIQSFVEKTKARVAVGSYNQASWPIYQALDCHAVKGLKGAVFGTEIPWLEGMLFAYGAENLVTVEFRTTISHIPNHVVLKPLQWVQSLQNGSLSVVDFAWSFSSWEHDGLGRYGDPLDPWGDIKAMQRASCYVKPGGLFYFGGPSSSIDQIMYNAHRIYGPVRLPLLTANWEVLGVYDASYKVGVCGTATCEGLFPRWQEKAPLKHFEFQPIIVLRNLRTSPCQLGQV